MKKAIVWAMSLVASLCVVSAAGGSFAYAETARDVSELGLSVKLKENVFTYTGGLICPEYMLTGGETGWTSSEYKCADYTIGYRYNIDAGTGKIVAVGTGNYSGQQTLATFTILPRDIKDVSDLTVNVGFAEYTGKPAVPVADVYAGARQLRESVDYTISAVNNVNVGYTTGSVDFKGNYSGSRSIYFKIGYAPINHFTARQQAEGNVLKWDKVSCDKINVYRMDGKSGVNTLIGTTTGNEFTDTTAPQLGEYHYFVQSQTTANGKQYTSTSQSRTVETTLRTPQIELNSSGGRITVSWNSNPEADGYILYMDGSVVSDLSGTYNTNYTVENADLSDKHLFSVSAYAKRDGQMIFSPRSKEVNSSEKQEDSVLRDAKKTDSKTFTITNVQKQTSTSGGTVTLSESDIATLDKFAAEHFTDNMTDTDKLRFTLDWINRNTKYALSTADWSKIKNSSYVDAIFNKKTGQCAQYNGAMVSMMRYLGYEANIVLGWRGSWPGSYWQHYWGEIDINGTTYILETGNYGRSGSWSFFLAPYNYTDGKYIKNCKNMQASYGGWYY